MTDQALTVIKKVLTSTDIMTRFASLMGERESTYYINSVILTVANSKDLQECTPNSIVYSALRAASLKLSCDPALGEAYLVPFNNNKRNITEASFIPGYKGLRNLATRTNKYRFVNAGPVYNGEQMLEERLTGQTKLVGKRIDDTVIGWFACFEMFSGYSKVLYMTVEEIHDHAKHYSKSYNFPKSKWQSKDPLEVAAMEKKTVFRLLLVRWGDLGEAGNAFVEDEIVNGDFKIEMPADDEPKEKRTEKQIMAELGYDTEPENGDTPEGQLGLDIPPGKPAGNGNGKPPMTLEEAENTTNSKGMPYGDIGTKDLSYMANSLSKVPTRTSEQEDKLLAIRLILAERSKPVEV
jgi:phage RecT family recombinase